MPYKDPKKRKQYMTEWRKKYIVEWRKKNRDRIKKSNKKWYDSRSEEQKQKKKRFSKISGKKLHAKYRKQVLVKYGGNPPVCSCCGEQKPRFLTIDHIENDGNIERKSGRSGVQFLRYLIKENHMPHRYQILCYNCNCFNKTSKKDICPHKL